MKEHTRVALLESRWYRDSNISMRNLFELIAEISAGNPNSFHYEMASTPDAVVEAISRISGIRGIRYICLGMHGHAEGIDLPNGGVLTRTRLRNVLQGIENTNGSRLDGLYLASCSFGTKQLAHHVFNSDAAPAWIAGYAEAINWIEASAMDLLFFNELMKYAKKELTPVQTISAVSGRIMELAPDLARHLGFGIYVRRQGAGGAKNLLRLDEEDQ